MPLPSHIGKPKRPPRRFPLLRVALATALIAIGTRHAEVTILYVGFELAWFQWEGMAQRER